MLKKILVFSFLIISPFCYGESYQNENDVKTPSGFYEDIDPASFEEDEQETQPSADNSEDGYQQFYESNEVVKTPATKNYSQIYNDLEIPSFSYLHNIDPDQYYDMKDTTWSIYPLLRLNSPIYFKSIIIEPGYYLLTPREQDGKWFMLFKQNGIVKHIIPVYERDYTPEKFYDEHIPKPKLTKSQKMHMGILNLVGKTKKSKRKPPVKTYLEVNDLENFFVSIIIYYGNHKYSTLFRTVRL